MSKAHWLAILISGTAAGAGGQNIPPSPESTPHASELETRIENSRRTLAAELKAADFNPEERAIRIEQWQKEQAPLLKQAQEAHSTPLRSGNVAPTPTAPVAPVTLEIPDDPLLADIQEIEVEIRDFRKSLDTAKLTPEQRAIQVEQFHQINRPVLAELESLKQQAARQDFSVAGAYGEGARAQPTTPQSELRRIMRDLAETDPETRAKYIEAHAATLVLMTNAIRSSSDSRIHTPTNQEAPIPSQKPTKP